VEIGGFDHQRIALPIAARIATDVVRQAAQLDIRRAPWIEVDELQAIHRIGVLLGEEAGALLNRLMRTKPLPMVHPLSSRPSDPFWRWGG
jgi:hypothetical protein